MLHCRENEVEEVKTEGPKEMTLDEWKAMQDKERTKVEFNIRKPNEGADSQWKKGYVLHKSKSEDVSVAIFHWICCVIRLGSAFFLREVVVCGGSKTLQMEHFELE